MCNSVRVRRRHGLIAVLIALCAACGDTPSQHSADRPDGTLRVAMETDARGFDPLQTPVMGLSTLTVADALFDTLLQVAPDGTPGPGLATSIGSSDDGLRWTVSLRAGVRFHDGTPFDASAVSFHFQRLLDPQNKCACKPLLGTISRVYAAGAHEVVFELSAPWATLPVALAEPSAISLIGSPAAHAQPGGFDRAPVGTGPWRLLEWQSDQAIIVVRHENYWDAAAYADAPQRIEFRVLPDQQARLAALRAGDVDLLWTLDADTAVRADVAALRVDTHVGAGARVLVMNTRRPPFDDVRVRRAIAHAADGERWTRTMSQGRVAPTSDPFGPGSAWRCPSTYPAHDPDAASALLAAYAAPVAFDYSHTATPRGQTAGQVFQQFWTDVGMSVRLQPTAQGQLVSDVLRRRFQIGPWRLRDSVDPDIDLYGLFHSSSPFNMTGVSSPELDTLLDAMRRETDRTERQKLLCRIEEVLSDAVPWVFLGPNAYFAISGDRVRRSPGLQGGFLHVRDVRLRQTDPVAAAGA
jgi:peptide/nickel transport system substrate-binding protein